MRILMRMERLDDTGETSPPDMPAVRPSLDAAHSDGGPVPEMQERPMERKPNYEAIGRAVWKYFQARAVQKVLMRKLRGELIDATTLMCADCSGPAALYEHRDYGKPDDVVPICRPCNIRRGPAFLDPAYVYARLDLVGNLDYNLSRAVRLAKQITELDKEED
jgi:hypothetical protein